MDEPQTTLRDLFARGSRAHAKLALSFDVYASEVITRVRARMQRVEEVATPEAVHAALRATSGDDLFLVIACEQRVPGAWKRLTSSYVPRLERLASFLGAKDPEGVCSDLLGDLASATAGGGGGVRLASYLGSGRLFAWLAVVLRRRVLGTKRPRETGTRRLPLSGAEAIVTAHEDPLEAAVASELSTRLRELLAVLWNSLDGRERLVLLCKYRDGWSQRQIARVLHLSDTQVSRIVRSTIEKVRRGVLRHLRKEDPASFEAKPHLWGALTQALAGHLARSGPIPDSGIAKETQGDSV